MVVFKTLVIFSFAWRNHLEVDGGLSVTNVRLI